MASRRDPSTKVSAYPAGIARRLCIHGAPVELDCQVPGLDPTLGRLLGCFDVKTLSPDASVARGTLRPYDPAEVVRRLPPAAVPLHRSGDLTEIYSLDERSWIIDERWGMAEINFLRGQWRSWVLAQSALDPIQLSDLAVFWPLAQLLKGRGVHLTPALSVRRDHFAAMVVCPFGLESEMAALLARGYRILGQRWTALREEAGRMMLLPMPGMVRDPHAASCIGGWVDLTAGQSLCHGERAAADAVLIVDPGRRPKPNLRAWPQADAAMVLRLSWPMPELHPMRRHAALAARIAHCCPCFQVQLSRDPADLFGQLESLRAQSDIRSHAA